MWNDPDYQTNGNWGHGHVFKRPDGLVARCGGPAICKQCAIDEANAVRHNLDRVNKPAMLQH